MSDNINKRSGGPKHIREILKEAKKEWLKNRVEAYMVSQEFKETIESCKHVQILFIYIDGDPQYIRTIHLN